MNKTQQMVQNIIIEGEYAGQRIDNFLRTYLKGVPKSKLYQIIRTGEVRVHKKRVKPEYRLQEGDILRIPPIRLAEQTTKSLSPHFSSIKALSSAILYEDESILVLNKPSGIAVHGGSGLTFGVIEGLRALRPQQPFLELVHRLDRETSGVLLIAKKRSALRALHEQLRDNKMKKEYLALVKGHWLLKKQTVTAPLLKNLLQSGERLVKVNPQGKFSETRFEVVEHFSQATLVKAYPITGRTHQIRVHAQYIGHPIACDERYGEHVFDQSLSRTGLRRLFLHASCLRFIHPATEKSFAITAPLDSVLQNCLTILRQFST